MAAASRTPPPAGATAQEQGTVASPFIFTLMGAQRTCRRTLDNLTTPDGRYIIVRGRLWRATNPNLSAQVRAALVHDLMVARRQVKIAMREAEAAQLAKARAAVNAAKTALGERGPVWWEDGARDFNRHLIKNTPYAKWYRSLGDEAPSPRSG